ncbi:RNA recognition motif domain-containing protein [Paraburkholderia aspalathi]|uniref:RNA recognition motif domain-containing protein n=1 Tax=Paraburkholderia aspalathi TaxID=1324617 RepID=UPI0038B72EDD
MKLWISNLPLNRSDEDIRAFVRKYTEVEIDAMARRFYRSKAGWTSKLDCYVLFMK